MKRKLSDFLPETEFPYTIVKCVGEGSYGVVFHAKENKTDKSVAVKKCQPYLLYNGFPTSTLREINSLRNLKHPNIVRYLNLTIYSIREVFVTDAEAICLVFELLPRDLGDYLKSKEKFTECEKKKLFTNIVKGVAYIHSQGYMHRDLKPSNILVTNDGFPKIADFGLSKSFQLPVGKFTHEVGTLYYRAPEILLGTVEYCTEIDIWSLGCIFYEIFMGNTLFKGDSEIGQLYKIFQMLGTPNEDMWPGVSRLNYYVDTFPQWRPINLSTICPKLSGSGVDLLEKMIRYDPTERISSADILKHPFLKKYSK